MDGLELISTAPLPNITVGSPPTDIGKPIKPMVDRVKKWLAEGKEVKIFTARVYPGGRITPEELDQVLAAITAWCVDNIGQSLAVTCYKDYGMVELWDDRAVQVILNTGERADGR